MDEPRFHILISKSMKGSPEAGRNEVPPSGGTAELSDRPLRSIESSQTPFHLNGKKYTPGDIV